MNAKAVVPLIAGLGIAGLAAKLGLDYVKRAQGSAPKTVQVWSVNMDVPRGSTIDEVNLKQMNFPLEFVPKGAITDTKQLIGRVPHTGVPADVPVLESMLLPPGTKPGIHVPTGFRAIAVKIDDGSGVDNHLDPGCHVDVVGYFQIKNPTNGKQETIARTIVENVQVAAVGQRLAPEAPDKNQDPKAKSKQEQPKPARAVTLLVKPEDVPIVHLAEQKGEIKLSMRADDEGVDPNQKHRTVKELDVTGIGEPEPQPKEDAGQGLGGLLSGLMGNPADEPKPEPQPQPEPVAAVPAEPPPPQYENVITIYLGNEKRVIGWLPGNPEPIELSAAETTNVFEETKKATAKNKAGDKPEGKDAKPKNEPVPQPEPEPEQQPKELIG